ncbi:MAG: hypothetical protein ACAH80_05825 [Alphaproteobacteria bacterium]
MKHNFIISPEFHRNLWLRFSPFSLLAVPLLLALVAFVCIKSGVHTPEPDAGYGALANVMLGIYFIVVLIGGSYEAGTALQDEVRNNTWDFQRMSSISAAKLAFGKLFGATAYHWYFGLMALCFFAYGYENYQVQPYHWAYTGGPPKPEPVLPDGSLPVVLVYVIMAGLMGQVLAFVSGFYDIVTLSARGGMRGKMPKGVNAFILGLVCSGWVFSGIAIPAATHLQRGRVRETVSWLGETIQASWFIPLTLLFFFFWFLVGAYRLARAELMYSQTPVAWLGFTCSAVFWVTGFMHRGSELAMPKEVGYFGPLLMGFIIMAMITYCTMLNESHDTRRYGRFWNYLQTGQLRRMLENTPKWIVTAPVTLLLYVTFLAYAAGLTSASVSAEGVFNPGTISESALPEYACLLLSVMLFMMRDGLAVHAIHLGVRRRGAGFVILFYYLMAYVVLPLVTFAGLGESVEKMLQTIFEHARSGELKHMAGFFFPLYSEDPTVSVFPGLLQAGIAAGVLCWAMGKRKTALETPQVTEKIG